MRLSRLYSNKESIFPSVTFNESGLSAVLAEIRLPENRNRDTHNLGKSTFVQLIDFCLLKSASSTFFLLKHRNKFAGFVFYLEIELPGSDGYLTIQRSVDASSRISFKRHPQAGLDGVVLTAGEWDHLGLPLREQRLCSMGG